MPAINLPSRSVEGVLTLLHLPGVGQKTAAALARQHPTLDAIRAAASGYRPTFLPVRAEKSLRDAAAWIAASDRAHSLLGQAAEHGVKILTAFDSGFPPLLRSLPDGPLVLYVRGTLREGTRNVACIGTREPSRFGTEVTRRLVACLVEHDWGIVSGLARGIDAESHRAALDAKGYTVAVLANGLDRVYPRENRQLADEILEHGGALVSEQPFGIGATPSNLVQRDRLQSGMSIATIVMQTDLVGGSMHTVRFTLSQGRLLAAPVPRGKHAEEPKSRGLLALTESTGAALADLLDVHGDYRQLLLRRYADCAPAFAVRSRADYADLLQKLSQRLTGGDNPATCQVAEQLWK